MPETRKSNTQSQRPSLIDKKDDVLRQAVELEYTKLYRETRTTAQKSVRHILRHVAHRPPPCSIQAPIPESNTELDSSDDDAIRTISCMISDGSSQKPQKKSMSAMIMPAVSSIRELISYVPAMKNIATRGDLTGIPYLGDTFDREDQELINSISGEPTKPSRHSIRKNKLDESSIETLYQTLRSNELWKIYSNEQLIDAILYHHRDSTPRTKLLAMANQREILSNKSRHQPNIDTYENLDIDIDNLVIKSWCSRFCPRCYTYNCLLHTEKPSHLPLPKQFSICHEDQSPPCCSTCYKNEREHLKRALSPSRSGDQQHNTSQRHLAKSPESTENAKKRQRKSAPSTTKMYISPNKNVHHNSHLHELQKKTISQHLLTRIENHMINSQTSTLSQGIGHQNLSLHNWTLTDRSLFRLFYFALNGDLCILSQLFNSRFTCQDLYQRFISDARYFSDRMSLRHGLTFSIRKPYRRKMLEGATRAFLLHIKKHMNNNNPNSSNQKSTSIKAAYHPCLHEGPCTINNPDCHCMKNGTYCEKFCNCPIDCPHRFPGCACKGACLLNNCLCCAEGRECDPDLCHKCGASLFLGAIDEPSQMIKQYLKSEPETPPTTTATTTTSSEKRSSIKKVVKTKTNEQIPTRQHSLRTCRTVEPSYKVIRSQTKRTHSRNSLNSNSTPTSSMITCANISLQRKLYKQILVAESDVAGYGAFLGSPIAYPGDLIGEYTGEIISEEEADRRGRLYDKQACSYLFTLDTNRCVDARQFGSKMRFANHSSKPNCVPKIKLVNGDYRIGIYAKQTILQGDELFFEYMYDAHQRQQFVNNERIDELEQDGLLVLKRYGDNFALVQSSFD